MIRIIAEATAEHPHWWEVYVEIIKSPAHWAGEFTIEMLFAVIGVHTMHRIAHAGIRTVIKRATHAHRIIRRAR